MCCISTKKFKPQDRNFRGCIESSYKDLCQGVKKQTRARRPSQKTPQAQEFNGFCFILEMSYRYSKQFGWVNNLSNFAINRINNVYSKHTRNH